MNSLFQAALDIQQTMMSKNWPFCFIGGLAVIRWGEMRMTQDIDLCLSCGFGNEQKHINQLIKIYKSRIEDPLTFALTNRVLLLYSSNGVAVDISLSGLPFEDEMIRRASSFPFYQDFSLITCSAEDLVVLKAFAGRSKDWNDIETITIRHIKNLDVTYIMQQLTPLCELKESPENVEKLKKIILLNKKRKIS